jgi:hypothetical protein
MEKPMSYGYLFSVRPVIGGVLVDMRNREGTLREFLDEARVF